MPEERMVYVPGYGWVDRYNHGYIPGFGGTIPGDTSVIGVGAVTYDPNGGGYVSKSTGASVPSGGSQQVGYQSADQGNKIQSAMSQSPTGRQMVIDGTFVVSVYTDDPASVLLQPANGTVVMWDDGGTLRLRGYTRATGWQTL